MKFTRAQQGLTPVWRAWLVCYKDLVVAMVRRYVERVLRDGHGRLDPKATLAAPVKLAGSHPSPSFGLSHINRLPTD